MAMQSLPIVLAIVPADSSLYCAVPTFAAHWIQEQKTYFNVFISSLTSSLKKGKLLGFGFHVSKTDKLHPT